MTDNSHASRQPAADPLQDQILQDPALMEALAIQDQLNRELRAGNKKVWAFSAMAASVVVAAFLWFAMPDSTTMPHQPRDVVQLSSQHISKDVVLPDGSQIAMNRHSQLHYLPSTSKRIVTFDSGEAFFDVARDESRPFVIASRDTTITVLGTAFNLDVSKYNTQLNVFHGKVKVENSRTGEVNILTKGQGVILDTEGQARLLTFSHHKPLWQNGWIAFSALPLKHAVEKLNRYAQKRLILGPGLGQLPISGRFKTEAADDAIMLIADMHQLQVSEFEDSLVIEKAGP